MKFGVGGVGSTFPTARENPDSNVPPGKWVWARVLLFRLWLRGTIFEPHPVSGSEHLFRFYTAKRTYLQRRLSASRGDSLEGYRAFRWLNCGDRP